MFLKGEKKNIKEEGKTLGNNNYNNKKGNRKLDRSCIEISAVETH